MPWEAVRTRIVIRLRRSAMKQGIACIEATFSTTALVGLVLAFLLSKPHVASGTGRMN